MTAAALVLGLLAAAMLASGARTLLDMARMRLAARRRPAHYGDL